MAACIDLSI